MNKNTTPLAVGTIATAALVLLSACSSNADSSRTSPTTRVAASPAAASPSPTGPQIYRLKDTADFGDITIRLDKLRRGHTGKVGVPEDTDYIRISLTLTNGSTSPFDLSNLLTACVTEEVYDGTHGLSGAPTVHVLPDKFLTWDIACAQKKDVHDFQIEISPRRDGDRTAIFSGNVR